VVPAVRVVTVPSAHLVLQSEPEACAQAIQEFVSLMNTVEALEQELLGPLGEFAQRLTSQFPDVKANVYSGSVGSLTQYQGYHIGVDCLLNKAPDNQPDNVALCIDVAHAYTDPKIDANVCWGHPSGHVEAEFTNEPLAVSTLVLKDLYADIPRLQHSLIEALERGKPSDWDERRA
jgi:hypothetical protein